MDIEKRLQRLERTNAILLALLATAGIRMWFGGPQMASAAQPTRTIIADSVEARVLVVRNPYGNAAVVTGVGVDGRAGITITGENGKPAIGLSTDPGDGWPSICLSYPDGPCRVVIGGVYRQGNERELSVQLRDTAGAPIWMPPTPNPAGSFPARGSGR